jgi:hypothetical protein
MTGDDKNNTAMTIAQDLQTKKLNIAILWGPMAGYVLSQNDADSYRVLPMKSTKAIQFDFSMAMGVRYGDQPRQQLLNKLIAENQIEINAIISRYQIPLLMIPKPTSPQKKDD